MIIIKKGVIPKEKNYQSTCGNCGTVFQFKEDECRAYHTHLRGMPITEIKCPFCKVVSMHLIGLDEFEVKE